MINVITHDKVNKNVNINVNTNINITLTYDEILNILKNINPDAAFLVNYYLN